MYLLVDFSRCIKGGVLRHYFIPGFNLLETKITHEAQLEIMQLFDMIILLDMSLMKYIPTLGNTWTQFISHCDSHVAKPKRHQKEAILLYDIETIDPIDALIIPYNRLQSRFMHVVAALFGIVPKSCSTPLVIIARKNALFCLNISTSSFMIQHFHLSQKEILRTCRYVTKLSSKTTTRTERRIQSFAEILNITFTYLSSYTVF